MGSDETVFKLTADGARELAEDPQAFARKLDRIFDDKNGARATMIMMRMIEGRERRELPLPTEEEIEAVTSDFLVAARTVELYDLVISGHIFPDAQDGEPVFGLSQKGRDYVERNSDDLPPGR
jgi:hypothetical protein